MIMAENKTMDSVHKNLLKKYHALCAAVGMTTGEKDALLSAYNVESSRDLDTHDLVDICADLSKRADSRNAELDKLRKRLMAAIGQYLKVAGRPSNISIIKGIATRAAEAKDFNKIPKERLRNLTYLFNNKVKDLGGTIVIPLRKEELRIKNEG
jgi:hypothetical protein